MNDYQTYEHHCRWCRSLGIEPPSFSQWKMGAGCKPPSTEDPAKGSSPIYRRTKEVELLLVIASRRSFAGNCDCREALRDCDLQRWLHLIQSRSRNLFVAWRGQRVGIN